MHLAAAAGISCVAVYDALSGLKPLSELEEKINQGWKKRD
jgi:ADP-heptose:LPS heptosyltransferase